MKPEPDTIAKDFEELGKAKKKLIESIMKERRSIITHIVLVLVWFVFLLLALAQLK